MKRGGAKAVTVPALSMRRSPEIVDQSVSATLAGPEVADALDVDVGTALLSLNRTVRDVHGNGVEYLVGLYRPDMFRLEMPLSRVGHGDGRHWEPTIGRNTEASA